MAFIDQQFPCGVSLGAVSSQERKTDVTTTTAGYEERNSKWEDSRRVFNAAYGVKTLDDMSLVQAFFEQARGRLHSFRYKDFADYKSCKPSKVVSPYDAVLGSGTGSTHHFRLVKAYGNYPYQWMRYPTKIVGGTVRVAVDGVESINGYDYTVELGTGIVSFLPGHAPVNNAIITAGFEFDVEARFDTDKLDMSVSGVLHGNISSIPIIEIKKKLPTLPAEYVDVAITLIALEAATIVSGVADGYWLWEDGTVIEWS